MSRKKKGKQYERKRKRYKFTLSDEAHEFLQESVMNAPRFVESLIINAKTGLSRLFSRYREKKEAAGGI